MDTSKEYIKMCEKAEEIQKEYKPKTGDFHANKILFITTVYSAKYPFNKKKVWLPRQDQLQEMVKWTGLKIVRFDITKDQRRYGYYYLKGYDYHGHYTSMEQLWLAVVMKEKYHKIWNGEDWVEEKKV